MFTHSREPEPPSHRRENEVALQLATTPQNDIQLFRPDNAFLHGRQSPRDSIREILEAAARKLKKMPAGNTNMKQLRPSTSAQRKVQLLSTSFLPAIVTGYNSPDRKIRMKNSQMQNLLKLPHKKERHIIRNNTDLLSGSQHYAPFGNCFSLQTPYSTPLLTNKSYQNLNEELL